jgi:hypothetical protein
MASLNSLKKQFQALQYLEDDLDPVILGLINHYFLYIKEFREVQIEKKDLKKDEMIRAARLKVDSILAHREQPIYYFEDLIQDIQEAESLGFSISKDAKDFLNSYEEFLKSEDEEFVNSSPLASSQRDE